MKPLLLDLFCGQGGCSMGYVRAGFRVVGVDKVKQPRYPFDFIEADALVYLAAYGHVYDAIHASPPCQFGTTLAAIHRSGSDERREAYDKKHPNLIPQTRALLEATGKPYVIENVEGARKALLSPAMLCGTMFGLQTDCGAVLRRHRLFETNWLFMVGLECQHDGRTVSITGHGAHDWAENYARRTISVHGDHPRDPSVERERRVICVNGTGQPLSGGRTRTISVCGKGGPGFAEEGRARRETFPVSAARTAMGIDWMTMQGLSQAIPPAYTHYVGIQLREQLR